MSEDREDLEWDLEERDALLETLLGPAQDESVVLEEA